MKLRIFLVTTLVYLAVPLVPLTAAPPSHEASFRAATVPIVAFEPPDGPGRTAPKGYTVFGTGFVFQWNRRVVTCASVLDAIPSKHFLPRSRVGILVPPRGSTAPLEGANEFHAVSVTAIDRRLDVALLETERDTPVAPLTRGTGPARMGTDVAVMALHAKLLQPMLYRDYVTTLVAATAGDPHPLLVPAGLFGRGAHGAPAFAPATGELLGLVRVHTKILHRSTGTVSGFEPEDLGGAVIVPTARIVQMLESVQAPR